MREKTNREIVLDRALTLVIKYLAPQLAIGLAQAIKHDSIAAAEKELGLTSGT